MKPSDFLLGLTDFFAILLPGVVLTWLVAVYLPPAVACSIDLGVFAKRCGSSNVVDLNVRWFAFLVTAYILGHFVFLIAAKLDGLYDVWRRRSKPLTSDRTFKEAEKLFEQLSSELKGGGFTPLKWCMSFVQIRCPAARLDIERLEASQKLFRSLVAVCAAYAIHFFLMRALGLTAIAIALGALSFSRYCDQRWKMTELSYALAIMLSSKAIAGTSQSSAHSP